MNFGVFGCCWILWVFGFSSAILGWILVCFGVFCVFQCCDIDGIWGAGYFSVLGGFGWFQVLLFGVALRRNWVLGLCIWFVAGLALVV